MASLSAGPAQRTAELAERRFYLVMAIVMAATTFAGFAMNLAMGRSSFALPLAYHAHGVVFMGWLAMLVVQAASIASGRRDLHRAVGRLAYLWIPTMVVLGATVMVVSARRTGGPFFFAQNEFLVSNLGLLLCFAALALWSLRARRHSGWHRRLMICAMAVLTGPGLGRLLPLPLLIPNAWTIAFVATLVLPGIMILNELRRSGRVHPAWVWGVGIYIAVFVSSMLLAYSSPGYAFTHWVIDGTPGAARPMEAFVPPGFTM